MGDLNREWFAMLLDILNPPNADPFASIINHSWPYSNDLDGSPTFLQNVASARARWHSNQHIGYLERYMR